jgi:hypothetical protein
MSNMKVAAKIGIGFAAVIAIMLALGGLAYMNLLGVQGDTGRIDRETVLRFPSLRRWRGRLSLRAPAPRPSR